MIKLYTMFLLLAFGLTQAQTADEIVKKNIEKTGGLELWTKLTAVSLKGEAIFGVGESYPILILQKKPNLNKVSIKIGDKYQLLDGYDGQNGWKYNTAKNKNSKVANYKPEDFETDIINYNQKGYTINLIGKTKVKSKDCYKIELTKNTKKIIYCFDTTTYYLISEETAEETLYYNNYKKEKGLTFPYRIESHPKAGEDYTMNFTEIKINPEISDKEFKF